MTISAAKKQGFTIVEVIVSVIIFLIAAAGIFATISSLSQPAGESNREIAAALVAKQILADLRRDMDMTDWDGGDLSVGTHPWTAVTVDGVTYTPQYVVETDPQGTDARKVTLTITW